MTINLLPPKLKKEKELKRFFNLAVISLFLVFIILLLFTGVIYSAGLSTKNQISKNDAEILEQTVILKKLSDTEQKVGVINSKLDKIGQIDSARVIWSNVIKDMANDTPQKVQIKTL